jgi:hypothetical protein
VKSVDNPRRVDSRTVSVAAAGTNNKDRCLVPDSAGVDSRHDENGDQYVASTGVIGHPR